MKRLPLLPSFPILKSSGSIGWRLGPIHPIQFIRCYRFLVQAESGLECKAVGPASTCFCGHRLGSETIIAMIIWQVSWFACPFNAVASQVSWAHLGWLSRDQAERGVVLMISCRGGSGSQLPCDTSCPCLFEVSSSCSLTACSGEKRHAES